MFFAAIEEEKIRYGVVADEQIHPAVVVDVRGDDSPCFSERGGDAGFFADVGESAVAIVVEQIAGLGSIDIWFAVPAFAGEGVAAEFIFGSVEIHEAADEQIEAAVIVVIKPDGAAAPAGSGDAGFGGDVAESAVAVIAIEDAVRVLRDVEVGETVGIVIADSDAHAVGVAGDSGFFGYVGESAVAIIAIECVAQGLRRTVEIAGPAVDEVDVHPAVVVVIEEAAAGADGFRQIPFGRAAVGVCPVDSGGGGRHFFEGGRGGRQYAGTICGEMAEAEAEAEAGAGSELVEE